MFEWEFFPKITEIFIASEKFDWDSNFGNKATKFKFVKLFYLLSAPRSTLLTWLKLFLLKN